MARVGVVIPAKDCDATIERVVADVRSEGVVDIIVVDDGSAVPIASSMARVIRHPVNLGYGAAQKTGYAAALAMGVERVVLVHGDGQYDIGDTLALADALADAPAALGSRFLVNPRVIPGWRRLGNRFLTTCANLRFGTAHTELHSGARAFRADTLRSLDFHRFSDDYLFDQQILCALLRKGSVVAELPVRVRYDTTVQSISLRRSIVYGVGCLRAIAG